MAIAYTNNQFPRKVNFGWISESFQVFKRDPWVWVGATTLFGVFSFIPSLLMSGIFQLMGLSYDRSNPFATPPAVIILSIVSYVIEYVILQFLLVGTIIMANRAVRGERITFNMLFSGGPVLFSSILFSILFGLLSLVGAIICFLCPPIGLLLAYALFMPGYALIADGEDVSVALGTSYDRMKPDMWNAAAFFFCVYLLFLLSCITVVGIFIATPMYYIIIALICRDMIKGSADPGFIGSPGPQAPGVWPPPPIPGGYPGTPASGQPGSVPQSSTPFTPQPPSLPPTMPQADEPAVDEPPAEEAYIDDSREEDTP